VPDGTAVTVSLAGLDHIRQTRRESKLKMEERESFLGASGGPDSYIRRAGEYRDRAGRQLDSKGDSLKKR